MPAHRGRDHNMHDPDVRAHMQARHAVAMAAPQVRAALTAAWADPEARARRTAAIKAGLAARRAAAALETPVPAWVPRVLVDTYRAIAARVGEEAAASQVRRLKAAALQREARQS